MVLAGSAYLMNQGQLYTPTVGNQFCYIKTIIGYSTAQALENAKHFKTETDETTTKIFWEKLIVHTYSE